MPVRPAFRSPNTTRYMPSEKITTCQGASRSIATGLIALPRAAVASRIAAPTAATALIGIRRPRAKKPTSSRASTIQPTLEYGAVADRVGWRLSAPTS